MTDLSARTELTPAAVPTPRTPAPQSRRSRDMGRSIIRHVLLIAASLIMIYPVLWLLVSSFRPTEVGQRSIWATYPVASSSKAALFAQAEKLSDDALTALLAEQLQ